MIGANIIVKIVCSFAVDLHFRRNPERCESHRYMIPIPKYMLNLVASTLHGVKAMFGLRVLIPKCLGMEFGEFAGRHDFSMDAHLQSSAQ